MTGLRCEWVAFALSMLYTDLQVQSTCTVCTVAAEVALPSPFQLLRLFRFNFHVASHNDPKCWEISSQTWFKSGVSSRSIFSPSSQKGLSAERCFNKLEDQDPLPMATCAEAVRIGQCTICGGCTPGSLNPEGHARAVCFWIRKASRLIRHNSSQYLSLRSRAVIFQEG